MLPRAVPDKHAHLSSSALSPDEQRSDSIFSSTFRLARAMADRPGGSLPALPRPARSRNGLASTESSYPFRRRVQPHAPASSDGQLLVFLAFAVTLAALLVLAGVTLTVGFVALVAISPLLLITSPLWAPLGLLAIVAEGALLLGCGLAVLALGAGTWAHRRLTGRHPVGAHRVGYAYPHLDVAGSPAWRATGRTTTGGRRRKYAAPGA
ncbi:oleosin-like [Lolium perenne]|uniref:oleosin-like n=1 Tax=Lolium perenne TaxID=4522 RepID=UPI0021F56FB7|nr:oleosin-like [Lolium perenne]